MATPQTDQQDKYQVLGKIAWLWMNSPMHVSWTVDLLSRFTLPAIEANQYILLERDGFPVAYCTWAYLTRQAEARYMINPSILNPNDWVGGDRLWFVDWVSPFSKKDSVSMKNQLVEMFPLSLARAIRVKKDKKVGRVMEFRGRKLDPHTSTEMLNQYYQDFLKIVFNKQLHFQK